MADVDARLVGLLRGARVAVASFFPERADVTCKHMFAGCVALVKQWLRNAECTLVPFVSPSLNDGSVDQTIYIDALVAKSGPAIEPATRYIAVACEQVNFASLYSQPDAVRFYAHADAVWVMDLPDWSFQTNPSFIQRGVVVPRAVVPAMLGTYWNDGTDELGYTVSPAGGGEAPLPRVGLLFGSLHRKRVELVDDVRRLLGERAVLGGVRVENHLEMGPGLRDALQACCVTFINNAYEEPCMPTLHRLAYVVRYLRPGAVAVVEQCDQAPFSSWLIQQWWPIVQAVPAGEIADCVVQHIAGFDPARMAEWHAAAARVRKSMQALWSWNGEGSWIHWVRRALPPDPVPITVCVCFEPFAGFFTHVVDVLWAAIGQWPSVGALSVGLAGSGAKARACVCLGLSSFRMPIRIAVEEDPADVGRAWSAAVHAACALQVEGGSHIAVLHAGGGRNVRTGPLHVPALPWCFRSADIRGTGHCQGEWKLLAADGKWECVAPASFSWRERMQEGDIKTFAAACEEAGPRSLPVGSKQWAIGTCVMGLMLAEKDGCRTQARGVLRNISTTSLTTGVPPRLRAAACRRLAHLLREIGDEAGALKALLQAEALFSATTGAAVGGVEPLEPIEAEADVKIRADREGDPHPEPTVCVAFFIRHFSERGTEVSTFAYAHYNEVLLGNRSIIVHYPEARTGKFALATGEVYTRFVGRFPVFEVANAQGIAEVIAREGVHVLYTQTSGGPEPAYYAFDDKRLWKGCGTIKHAVFQTDGPEGDVFCGISSWVVRHNPHMPVLPLIVEAPGAAIPDPAVSVLRRRLGIPPEAVVFGRHGGRCTFNIGMALEAVVRIAQRHAVTVGSKRPIYFLFMNTDTFCKPLDRVKHVSYAVAPAAVHEFIEACDAMLHARADGETFGLACAEFAVRGKPVVTTRSGDLAHLQFLGAGAVLYASADALEDILVNYETKVRGAKHGPHEGYGNAEPQVVMETFATLSQLAMDRAKIRDLEIDA